MTKIEIQEPRAERYNPHAIEPKWQETWERDGLYTFREDASKTKHYALTMFPYPSGNLHIGHWYAATGPDIVARMYRMQGFNVMFPTVPQGLDDFVDLVVPELQRRGLFRQEYAGATLRDHLGLPRPVNRFFP